ncbi:hypothetical protein KAFR_0L01810 [Kazachstania africana CBS 2517]|uniref:Nucleoporin Nup133/Nup155-like N-terminal domain-containing protein n=1 Tax=Kazachstania africana (strain ATCC 22294 / BCRC 22015 / CBS 2517 / CECT 1963 / NBRC 1671 / NRRL Y-8276) TaxID=1071382 RepID=H2B2E1_KAZAF|nr:hypothetical protein KAFR_0L01810 [Kazachstania africana CBS 2517]CCF60791.1 hypothetical protein KAFR_0L01810 [Kazachstania africana CBS 2517]
MFSTPLRNRIDYSNNTFAASTTLPGSTTNLPSNPSLLNTTGTSRSIQRPDAQNNDTVRSVMNLNSISSLADINATNAATTTSANLSDVNEHIRITGLGSKKPLELASEYIDHLQRRDANTPILDERSYYNNGVNYNFSREAGGLGAFTPFERQKVISIPDELLQEASKTEIKSDMGIFPEINRCWIIIDNKLVLWNIDDSTDYQFIEEIKHTILNVALVDVKPNTFVSHIKHLLLITTPFDIYLLALSHNRASNELEVYNTGMTVSINGLGSLEIATYRPTGQIFFISKTTGLNIWELQYTGSDDWFNSKCTKICLTQSAWSNLLPTNLISKLPGSDLIQSLFEENSQETLIQIIIDQSRGVVYTLSSRSIVRAYLISGSNLEGPVIIEPSYIGRIIGTTTARGAAIMAKKYLKISKIIPVSQQENNNLFFVALTVGGVRLYFNGSIGRSNIEAIRLESIKFPPSSVTPEVMQQELQQQQIEQQKRSLPFYSSLTFNESILLKLQKKSSVLLETTSASTIISPGIFFSSVLKTPQQPTKVNATLNAASTPAPIQHRLFVSVPDYGILKNHGKYVENATFLDTTSPVKQIVPLTPSFNATDKPSGYANAFASQYNSENLRVAVLTNNSVEIYRYRNPDEVFETLIDNPLAFVLNYGLAEACSTALFVTCKFNKSEVLRSNALTFLTVGIPGVVDIKPKYNRYSVSTVSSLLSKPSLTATPQRSLVTKTGTTNFDLDDVILSPRFYGIGLLITRLFREVWNRQIFSVDKDIKFDARGQALKGSLNGKNVLSGICISKEDVGYYLSSILILNEFFATYSGSIAQPTAPLLPTDKAVNKAEEVASQAESMATNSLIKLVESIKEALSFLNVFYEESEVEGYEHQYLAFKDIVKFLKVDVQTKLSKLTFKDLFAPTEDTKSLVREILLSIINRNINRGASIEYTATTLQDRCGSFCSSSDILSFRAIEHLKKAREIGLRDNDTLSYHLNAAIKLFERIVNDLSMEKLKEAIDVMISLNYFPKTIEFLLNIANAMDKGKLAYQYVANGCLENDERKKYFDKRVVVYDLVFETLVKLDELAGNNTSSVSGPSVISSDAISLKDKSYEIVLNYDDKLFHYHLYDWLVAEKSGDRLLQLDTKFILPYLKEKAKDSLKISNLLWVYHSRKSNFYHAAEILYSLAISDFDIKLTDRIECLSRANGFCNSVCPPSQKQDMVQLSSLIQELFDIAAVQDDVLNLIKTDNRIDVNNKEELSKELDGKILPVSDLFNDYAVPLGYHEVALNIFKISDFRNEEEILSKWNELFDSLKRELSDSSNIEDSVNFVNLLSNVVVKIARNVHTSEFVFPISELFPRICSIVHEALPTSHIKEGSIISIFISAGVSFSKLYYVLKDLIQTSDSANVIFFKKEMTWLIKEWYQSDRKLRDIISFDDISNLKEYSVENDPLEKYTKKTGNSV